MQNLNHLPIHQLNGWEDIYLLIFGHNQQEKQQEQVITRLLDSQERLRFRVDTLPHRNEQICFQQLLLQVIRWGETGLLLVNHLSLFSKAVHNIYET